LRIAYSHYLVPNPDTQHLLSTLRGFAGLAPVAQRRLRGPGSRTP
jgi:hypothetical protein